MLTVVGYDDEGNIIYTGRLPGSISLTNVIKHITKMSNIICYRFEVTA